MSKRISLKRVFFLAVICVFALLCFLQSARAGSILSWGEQRFDGRDFENTQFIAIAAAGEHNIAIKSDGSIKTCEEQGLIYPLVLETIEYVESLI